MLLLKSLQRISVTLLTHNSSPSLPGLCGPCSAYFWIYHLSHSLFTPFQYFYYSLDKTSLLVLLSPWVITYMVPFFHL